MNQRERIREMEASDNLVELLESACNIGQSEARKAKSRINSIESFFEEKGFNRGKPRKMAILYIMMRYGHTPRTVEKWWGETDSSYNSFSASLGLDYLEEIKEVINNKVEVSENSNWTPGDKVYEPSEDPLQEHFNIEDQGRNAKISSFS